VDHHIQPTPEQLARYRTNLERTATFLDRFVDRMQSGQVPRIAGAAKMASSRAQILALLEPESEELKATVELNVDALRAQLEVARAKGTEVSFPFQGGEIRTTAGGQSTLDYMGAWEKALGMALAVGYTEQVEGLLAYPFEDRRTAPRPWHEAYLASWAAAVGGQENAESVIRNAEDVATKADRDFAEGVVWPTLSALSISMEGAAHQVGIRLEDLLYAHREYWTSGGRSSNLAGTYSWRGLAVLRFARSNGYEVEMESPYFPPALLP
jgi:hypothetical protein